MQNHRTYSPAVQFAEAHFIFSHKRHSRLGTVFYISRVGEVLVGINITPAHFKSMIVNRHISDFCKDKDLGGK